MTKRERKVLYSLPRKKQRLALKLLRRLNKIRRRQKKLNQRRKKFKKNPPTFGNENTQNVKHRRIIVR